MYWFFVRKIVLPIGGSNKNNSNPYSTKKALDRRIITCAYYCIPFPKAFRWISKYPHVNSSHEKHHRETGIYFAITMVFSNSSLCLSLAQAPGFQPEPVTRGSRGREPKTFTCKKSFCIRHSENCQYNHIRTVRQSLISSHTYCVMHQ
jgi:hypothetical protein